MTAVAIRSDAADLVENVAVVEKAQDRATMFEAATNAIRMLKNVAESGWDSFDEAQRDILRSLAHGLNADRSTTWIARQRAKVQVFKLMYKVGVPGFMKQVADFENARREFISAIFAAEERNNAALQEVIANAVQSAVDDNARTRVTSKGELSEWFKRLPS